MERNVIYAMLGASETERFAAHEVTSKRALKLARDNDLVGYMLLPVHPETGDGGIKTYLRDENKKYQKKGSREWAFTYLLNRGKSDGSEYDGKPVQDFAEVHTEETPERVAARIFAHEQELHLFCHEDGKFTVWAGPQDGNTHTSFPLASGNLKTGERWTNQRRSRQEGEGT